MFISKRTTSSVLSLCCLVLALNSGCSYFKKSSEPKPSGAIASEMEAEFKQRFVDKRAGELAAQGVAPEAARTQANEEFRVRYGATTAAQK